LSSVTPQQQMSGEDAEQHAREDGDGELEGFGGHGIFVICQELTPVI
jgi:hypothetical protein